MFFGFVFACVCCVFLGSCTCGAGFTGEHCESKCPQRFFGLNCEQVCQCEEGHHVGCDPVTGKCLCKPEWKGITFVYLQFFICERSIKAIHSLCLNCMNNWEK